MERIEISPSLVILIISTEEEFLGHKELEVGVITEDDTLKSLYRREQLETILITLPEPFTLKQHVKQALKAASHDKRKETVFLPIYGENKWKDEDEETLRGLAKDLMHAIMEFHFETYNEKNNLRSIILHTNHQRMRNILKEELRALESPIL